MGRSKKPPEVNSSSMADIAFLLLIFFLVTTTIASDKGLMLVLPPKQDPNQPPPDITKNQRNIFKVLVNSKDQLLVEEEPLNDIKELKSKAKEFILNFGKPNEDGIALWESLPPSLKAQAKRSTSSSDHPKEAVVSFKADRGTSYETYVSILDQLQGAYYEIYAERVNLTSDEFRALNTRNDSEKAVYDRAREGLPMNISIAEPSKVGGE